MINFLNLKYFVMIAEERNITRVAEQEHVSQQSLSNHIKKMEDDFGVRLFDRTGSLSLTYAGERVYNYAVQILKTKSDMENELLDIKETKQGILRIGISYTRGRAFLPEILPLFNKENPFIKTVVTENNSQVLEEYLLRGHIDLYIGSNLRQHPEIDKIDLFDEKLFLIVPKTVAKTVYNSAPDIFTQAAKIEDFKNYDFLMLSKANRLRKMIDDYLREQETELKILIETENIETLFELASKGMGITVYPEMFMKKHMELINSGSCPVCFIPLEGDCYKNKLSIGYNKKRYLSSAAKHFITLSKEIYQNTY